MLSAELPEIPRLLTALCEWFACVIYVFPLKKRFPGWRTGAILAAALPCQILLQYLAARGYEMYAAFFTGMAINVLFMMLALYIAGEVTVGSAVFWGMYAFSMAEFLASLAWQIIASVLDITTMINGWAAAVILLLLIAAFLFVSRLERPFVTSRHKYRWSMTAEAALIALTQFLFCNYGLGLAQIPWMGTADLQVSFGLIRTAIDFSGVLSLLLLLKLLQEHYRQQQMDAINHSMELQYQQYRDFRAANEYISRQCHDLKHQVAALRNAYSPEEREAYFTELEQSIALYNAYCNTGNPALDSILTQKRILCSQQNIQFSYNVDGKSLSPLTTRDISNIFGNLLDNAIEHVSAFPELEMRQVSLEVYSRNSFLVVQVENYCENPPSIETGLPETTKADKQMHGYGLKSVQLTVEQYNGTLRCQFEKNWFTVTLLIPVGQ